ncbi:hypothetical protein IQ07DRAFT_320168 [Pyrenochaeta sp. DS3sAY3a]|nr:hypothetical protein IQ07DRAFT_320168 [Pyrenochaeta sp. DS3sAY3a]
MHSTNTVSQRNSQLDSRTALRIATSDLLKQDIVMLISILRDIRAAADKRLMRGSVLLCIVYVLQSVGHICDADLTCRTFFWGVCRNARSSENPNGALNTIKHHRIIPSAVLQADLKNTCTHESRDSAKRQSVLCAARVLPLERWLLTGVAAASLYALFGISTRLIAGHCLKRVENIQRKLLKDRLSEDNRQDLIGWTWTWLYRVGGFW